MILAVTTYKVLQVSYHYYVDSFRPKCLFKSTPQILHPTSSYYTTNFILHSNILYDPTKINSTHLNMIKQIYSADRDLSMKISNIKNIISKIENRHLNDILKQIYIVPIFSPLQLKTLLSKNIIKQSHLTAHVNIARKMKDNHPYQNETHTLVRSYIIKYLTTSNDISDNRRYYIIMDLTSNTIYTSPYIFTQVLTELILQLLYHNTTTMD